MYNARFISDLGDSFDFGAEHGVLFDIDPLSGIDVSVQTSQGFQQTGVTIEGSSLPGITRNIKGVIVNNLLILKSQMLRVFSPGVYGDLYFEDKYFCSGIISSSPEFGEGDKKGVFTLDLFCSQPFWFTSNPSSYILGGYTAAFRFPVNYSKVHRFGIKNPTAFINCANYGVSDVDFVATFSASDPVVNYGIVNAITLEDLSMLDTLEAGDKVRVYRKNGRLRVEKNGNDIFSKLSEDSTLFTMKRGDNPLKSFADEGIDNLGVSIEFYAPVSGVYDGV